MGAIIGWQNWVDAPGVGTNATTTLGDLGPGNILTASVSEVWRGVLTTTTAHRLRVDLGQTRSDLSLFVLAAPRDGMLPGAAASARFVASNVAEDGEEAANVYSATNPFNTDTGLWVVRLTTPISARWIHWRVLGAAGDAYWQVGRAFAGPCLVTSRGIAPEWRRAALDTASTTRTPIVGTRFSRHGARARRLSFSLPALTATEAASLRTASAAAGRTAQVFAAPFADSTAAALGVLGTFAAPPDPQLRGDALGRYRATITVDEEI